jgi:glycosyltransferase involved in cell wall biosynthesis
MVSVVVPSYNTARYIGEALDSIFAQTFRDFEVIVVNDESPDTSELERILQNYQDRIHYIRQQNRGPGGARNTGMRQAKGEFLAFLDSDDIWSPDFLAEQLKFLAENPSVDMVCADCVFFGNGELNGKSWRSLHPIEPPVTLEKILPTHGGAFPSFVLLRRQMFLKVGFFDEELRIFEDYHYWLRLLHCGGNMAYSQKILGKRRTHTESITHDQTAIIPQALRALEKFAALLDPSTREAFLVHKEIAHSRWRVALKEGKQKLMLQDYQAARQSFASANAAVSSMKLKLVLLGLRWFPQWTRWMVARWDRTLSKDVT